MTVVAWHRPSQTHTGARGEWNNFRAWCEPKSLRRPGKYAQRVVSSPDELPFSFDAFNAWYETYRRGALEPARLAFCRLLGEELIRVEVEFGGGRFRPAQSRIKDPVRLWAKMHLPRYRSQISSLDAIPEVVDDLVGVRVVCTNKSDLTKIRTVLDGWERHSRDDSNSKYGIAVESGSERDYVSQPKLSGYRAFHLNLLTEVAQVGKVVPVRGELQVRTLLQDGWGELTHEDTYKPGQKVPELVALLSLRMGELLATVDDIAEDIQSDLTRLSQEAVSDVDSNRQVEPEVPEDLGSVSQDIVRAEAARLVSLLDKPTSLAQLAAQLRGTFGAQVSAIWRGQGNFKAFLIESVPGIHIVPQGPSYVVPAGLTADETWPKLLRNPVSADGGLANLEE